VHVYVGLNCLKNLCLSLVSGVPHFFFRTTPLGPDLQNILRLSYDNLTTVLKLRSTYDGRLIYKTLYDGRKAFLGYHLLVKL